MVQSPPRQAVRLRSVAPELQRRRERAEDLRAGIQEAKDKWKTYRFWQRKAFVGVAANHHKEAFATPSSPVCLPCAQVVTSRPRRTVLLQQTLQLQDLGGQEIQNKAELSVIKGYQTARLNRQPRSQKPIQSQDLFLEQKIFFNKKIQKRNSIRQ